MAAQRKHRGHAHHCRHKQIDRLRGKAAHDGTAKQRPRGVGNVAVEDHQAVHTRAALGGRLKIPRKCMRAGVDKTTGKSQNTCGKHQPGNGQRRQANAEGQHCRDRACHKRRVARAKAVDDRARYHIAHRRRKIAHERDSSDQKGRSRQVIRRRADKPQKVHRVVGAPLQGLNKN